jgi:hypothetical protein
MKYNTNPKQNMVLLITGLLLVSLNPLFGKYMGAPDFVRGFLSGLGITLETIALIKIQRSRKMSQQCAAFTK